MNPMCTPDPMNIPVRLSTMNTTIIFNDNLLLITFPRVEAV